MNLKQMAAIHAANYVKDDMIVGLGTGSTAYYLVEELGRRLREENLNIIGVTTSEVTAKQARSLNIPLKSIDDVPYVNLTIDGSDEVDIHLNGIKGGGGALLYEKTVATYSKDYIWIVDESKLVETLGVFPLPIEVIPYGHKQLFNLFQELGYKPSMRTTNNQLFITDSGNYIIDCHLEQIPTQEDAILLANQLSNMTGVVEHGLFLNMVNKVIVGTSEGIKVLENNNIL